jgi:hypothetical protein
MSTNSHSEEASKRIAHIKSHLDVGFDLGKLVLNIETQSGNPNVCASLLSSHALAKSMFAWFDEHDLTALKQWSFVAGKLFQIEHQMKGGTSSIGGYSLRLLSPLLSDCEPLINWYSQYNPKGTLDNRDDIHTYLFLDHQVNLVLRGDWQALHDRSEKALATDTTHRYLADYRFFLALAAKDISGMEQALGELTSGELFSSRKNDESGFTEDLISTPAVIYAKLAWRHGFQVKVDTPYIPQQWLPIAPLSEYCDPYEFMVKFDSSQPITK